MDQCDDSTKQPAYKKVYNVRAEVWGLPEGLCQFVKVVMRVQKNKTDKSLIYEVIRFESRKNIEESSISLAHGLIAAIL